MLEMEVHFWKAIFFPCELQEGIVKRKLDIVIIAQYAQLPGDEGNGRFHYLAEMIDPDLAEVEVVTTSFSHRQKEQREVTEEQRKSVNYKIQLLFEPGYKKNVSVARLFSHSMLGKNLWKYLKTRPKPDVIYCSIPSLSVAGAAAKYAKKHGVRFIIDIQDVWPEAFGMFVKNPIVRKVIFFPMRKIADGIYKKADHVIAVSQSYVDRALQVNKKVKQGHSVFLGTDLKTFDRLAKENKIIRKSENDIWLVYVGTLSHSYDIISVVDAVKKLQENSYLGIKFIIIGDGPLRKQFEEYAHENKVVVEFTGRLPYKELAGLLTSCDIAVNPIVRGSRASIINKHADYAAAGLPVLNTQECREYRLLLNEYEAGVNCVPGDTRDLADKLLILCQDEQMRKRMGKNSRRLAEERFDRSKTYYVIKKLITE